LFNSKLQIFYFAQNYQQENNNQQNKDNLSSTSKPTTR